jgi:hypothetical protein
MSEYDHVGQAGILGMTSWMRARNMYRSINWESFDASTARMLQRFFFGPVGTNWRLVGQLIFDTQAHRNAFIPLHNNFRRMKPYRVDRSRPWDQEEGDEGPIPLPPTFRIDMAFEDEAQTIAYMTQIQIGNPTGLVSALLGRHQCRFDSDEPPPGGNTATPTVYWSFP